MKVDIFDPWASPEEVMHEYNVNTFKEYSSISKNKYDAIILAVSHKEFLTLNFKDLLKENAVLYDIKSIIPITQIDARL